MKPDLKEMRERAERNLHNGYVGHCAKLAEDSLALLDYIGRLKEKLVDERRDRLSIEVLYYLITKEWPVPIYYHLLDEQAHDEIRQELSE